MKAPDIIYTDGKNTCAPAPVFSNTDGNIKYIRADLAEQPETGLLEEAYMRGFAQGAKEERESLSHTMLTYAADVFSGKMLLEDISYSYRQELAEYFRDLAREIQAQIKAQEE